MNVIYAHEHPPLNKHGLDEPIESIFLAGPSPRVAEHYNWRPEALAILERLGFHGRIYVPLPRDGIWLPDYIAQFEWEQKYLEIADMIAFWIPRDLKDLPGFATNVEFGMFINKATYGRPPGTPKTKYLDCLADKFGLKAHSTLEATLKEAVAIVVDRRKLDREIIDHMDRDRKQPETDRDRRDAFPFAND